MSFSDQTIPMNIIFNNDDNTHGRYVLGKDAFLSCSLRRKNYSDTRLSQIRLPDCQRRSFNLLCEGPGFEADVDSH